jgi:hypothetical protein
MDFKEWLLFNEQPEVMFSRPQSILLPDEHREPQRVQYDIIDMRFEDYWKKPEYNRQFSMNPDGDLARKEYWMNLFHNGFKAKLPFGTESLIYNAITRVGMFAVPNESHDQLAEAPRDWWAWSCFILGNDITYWKSSGIMRPAMRQTA